MLRELQAEQLHVIRKAGTIPFSPPNSHCSHLIHSLTGGDEQQSTLRVCAEAFFSRSVIVCEGKTEIGLVKGVDLYCQNQGIESIQAHGVYWADGGGQTQFQRAKIFKSLGYPTAILKDSDKQAEDTVPTSEAKTLGIKVFEWGNNYAIEDALFMCCPASVILDLIELAIERKGRDSINANIQSFSENGFDLDKCLNNFDDSMRATLSKAAKEKSWFKGIEPAEKMAHLIIMPNYNDFGEIFTQPINELFTWARSNPAGD